MKPKKYSSEGIVLARRSVGEADRILRVFSRDYGKISLIAKGVRRPKSRKRGTLEVFSKFKFSAVRGKSIDIVTEVEPLELYEIVRKDLRRASVAYYFCEVIGRLTQEDEEYKEIFILLSDYLEKLKLQKNLKELRVDFVYDCLVSFGYWPKGMKMRNPDQVLENITEREMNSVRVGKQILT